MTQNYPFLRFSEFNDKYEEYKLSDLSIKIFNGSTPKTKMKNIGKMENIILSELKIYIKMMIFIQSILLLLKNTLMRKH